MSIARSNSLGQLVTTTSNGGQLAGMRNRIINGDMRISQRGIVTPTLGVLTSYTLDRWVAYQTGTALAVSQTGGNGAEFASCLTFAGAAGNTEVTVFQCIESANVYDLATNAITISLWLWSDTPKTVNVSLETPTATANVFTSTTGLPFSTLTCSLPGTGWLKFSATYSAAQTAASAAAIRRGIRVRIGFTACTTGNFGITGVQLEAGTVATPFEQRPIGLELSLCQRYYQRFGAGDYVVSGIADGICLGLPLVSHFRAVPTFNTNIVDSQFTSTTPTGIQFALAGVGVSFATKSATISVNSSTTSSRVLVSFVGSSFSRPTNLLALGPSAYFECSAEL